MNDGVKAIAQGLIDGGVECAYNFPGFYSHDIVATIGDARMSLNERVAFAEAFGASLAGKRTVVAFKNVGLNVASDAFLHSIIAGVHTGLVLIVTDDIAVWGSQESQDSRHYFDFNGGLWLEPKNLQQAYEYAAQAFDWSEELDVPIVIRFANSFFKLKGGFKVNKEKNSVRQKPSQIKPEKMIVHPYYYVKQETSLQNKNALIKNWVERKTGYPMELKKNGIIIVGSSTYHGAINEADIFHITTLPLPEEKIQSFAKRHEELIIVEDGDDYVANKIRALLSQERIKTVSSHGHSTAMIFVKWERYSNFFEALADAKKDSLVVSEIAQFTVETYNTVDVALSLGTAVSTAIGYAERSLKFTFCLSGDCSFLHEGIGIIEEAIQRKVKLGLVIFDNHASWCTGGQPPIGNIENIVDNTSLKKFYLDYESANRREIIDTLTAMRDFDGVSVLYLKIPLGDLRV